MVLVCVFHTHHVFHIFDHTHDARVARWVGTNGAHLALTDVVATTAVLDFAAQLNERLAQIDGGALIALEQMEHKAQRGFAANAGQLRELVDSILK